MQLYPNKGLVPRKDRTVSVTVTETTRVIESTTIRETSTYFVNVTIYSTLMQTETQFSTINFTVPTTTTIQPPTLARLAPVLTSALHAIEPTVSPIPSHPAKMQTGVVLGIVLGSLAFLACVIAALLFLRRWQQKYRAERVARKQAVTEGNQFPEGFGEAGAGTTCMRYSGTAAGLGVPMRALGGEHVTGRSGNMDADTQEGGGNQSHGQRSSRWPRDEKKEAWEELPPAYS